MSTSEIEMGLTTSHEDWVVVRECYVISFRRYPLYKYMVPDESKRDEFLRAYLEANYEVTVGSGQGVLLGMWVDDFSPNENHSKANEQVSRKLIGGVLVVPPSSGGSGWAVGNDEPYWEAYEKHNLGVISKEGLVRVKRYEAWENVTISQKARSTGIPMWNGLFCAMLPEYTSRGFGTTVYTETLKLMVLHWLKHRNSMGTQSLSLAPNLKSFTRSVNKQHNVQDLLQKQLSSSKLDKLGLQTQKLAPSSTALKASTKDFNRFLTSPSINDQHKTNHEEILNLPSSMKPLTSDSSPPRPLLVAVSHSDKAACFHLNNGFETIAKILYYDDVENISPFYTHVLVIDPLHTGGAKDFREALHPSQLAQCSTN